MPRTNRRKRVDASGNRLCAKGHLAYQKKNGRWSCKTCERAYLAAKKRNAQKQRQSVTQKLVASGEWTKVVHPDEYEGPVEPTAERPGSDERIAVLAARSAAGLPLWVEGDANVFRTSAELTSDRSDDQLPRRFGSRLGRPRKKDISE